MSDFDFSPYKVLLCDTDPEVIDTARTTYLDANIGDFVATPSPKEALKHIPILSPDLILVSLKFPDTNGVQVIQKIRSLNEGQFYKTPILMLLEKVSQNLLREACRAGIEGALRKPLSTEKILRFSRAVILKPRRFVCIRHYFGPERRLKDQAPTQDADRRRNKENSTDEFTRPQRERPQREQPIEPGKSSLDSSPVLASAAPSSSSIHNGSPENETPDWGNSQSRSSTSGEGTIDFDTSSDKGLNKDNSVDYGSSSDLVKPAESEVDYGTTTDRKKAQTSEVVLPSAEPQKKEMKEAKPVEEATPKQEKKLIEPTGPETEEFEEIVDLDDCLELHKIWINSGGKTGKQAKRPNSNFDGQDLEDVDFTKAILPQSNFENVNCVNTVFRKADLTGSTFKGALLSSADLRVSLLRQADMRNARMDKANLLGADLAGANLEGATLRGVNMSGANLTRTNLCGVNLSAVQGLIPEQLSRAITDATTRVPTNTRKG